MTRCAALFASAALALGLAASARGAELTVLSGGAVEPGLRPVIAAYEAATGDAVRITFAAAPQIEARLTRGEAFDLVIAPLGVLDAAAQAGRLTDAARVPIGQVGIGVAVRADAPAVPEIATADELRRELLGAEAVIYNRASTGLAFERVLRDLGVAPAVEARAERPVDGAGVMERLAHGHGREIAFAATTEILLFKDRGVRYVGPLPPPLQRYTVYAAALPGNGKASAEGARRLLAHLASRGAQAAFAAAGIDPPPANR